MITKMVKSKKANKKSNSTVEEKPQKTIKKVESETLKLKKKNPKSVKTAVPVVTKTSKKIIKEESSDAAEESEIEDVDASVSDAEEPEIEEEAEASHNDSKEAEMEEDAEASDNNSEEAEMEEEEEEAPLAENEPEVALGHTVYVCHLPPKTTRSELAKLFAPYGNVISIIFINRLDKIVFKVNNRLLASCAYVVFDNVKAASKALQLDGTLLNKHKLFVTNPEDRERVNFDRTILVKSSKDATTDSLREIFSSCGEIDFISTPKVISEQLFTYASFKSPDAISLALELDGTLLDEQPITVSKYLSKAQQRQQNTVYAVYVKNVKITGDWKTDLSNLRNIFSSCGEIDKCQLMQKKKSGVVTFKTMEGRRSALELNGTLHDDQPIDVSEYYRKPTTTQTGSVFVTNLSSFTTEENLRKFFSTSGQAISISIKKSKNHDTNYAFVNFEDPASAQRAVKLSGSELDNTNLNIKFCTKKNKKPTATFKHVKNDNDFKHKMQEIGLKYLKMTSGKKHPKTDYFKETMQEVGLKYLNSTFGNEIAQEGKKKRSEFKGVRTKGIKKAPKKIASKKE